MRNFVLGAGILRFADIIAELREKYRDDLDEIERRLPTEAEMALWITQLELGIPSAPRDDNKYLTDDDVEKWIFRTGIAVEVLFDGIAMYLARGFHTGLLPFQFCDAIINALEVFTLRADSSYAAHVKNGPVQRPSPLLWDIYLAFDAGEYRRPGDDRNPVVAFTRPAVAEIVEVNAGFRYPDDSL